MIKDIIYKIKKKEYSVISNKDLEYAISEVCKKESELPFPLIEELNKKKFEKLVKKTREYLRHIYTSYHTKETKKVYKILENFQDIKEWHEKILDCHQSTKERLIVVEKFYEEIFKKTGIPTSIIDLACGLNPITSFFFDPAKEIKIKGYELTDFEVNILNIFAKQSGRNIVARKINLFIDLPDLKADQLWCFKFFELIPTKRVEEILNKAKVKYIIATFPTKTLSKQKMSKDTRAWLHLLLKRLKLSYTLIKFDNEIAYIIEK